MQPTDPWRPGEAAGGVPVRRWMLALGLAALYVAASPMPLLYHSNQNTKFLHGLAAANPDRLGADWTARTADGLPVFSFLVRVIAEAGQPLLFYGIEVALLAVMCLSLIGLARQAAPRTGASLPFLAIAGGLLVLVAGGWQDDALRGVAKQYLTLGYLQPAEFGILFLPALLRAGRNRADALVLAALPAAVHPAYIAFAAILVAVILYHRWRARLPLPWGPLALALVLLVLPPLDLAIRFAPSDAATFVHANEILAFERIPHHSDPARWADWTAARKLLIALVAIPLAPRGPIRTGLAALLALAVLGTVFVWLTGNPEVALAAPWRSSVIVAPVSVAILLGAVLDRVLRVLPGRLPWVLAAVVVAAALVVAGQGAGDKRRDLARDHLPAAIRYVRDSYRPGEVYLTVPEASDFRLQAMVPQFVTWKTHPYLDTEVLAWRARAEAAAAVFGKAEGGTAATGFDCGALDRLVAAYPEVTHVFVRETATAEAATCARLSQLYAGEGGWVYRIR